ncbi:Asp-tRNA(Asn)/Glu-tRNA(Gln) amidotransferase subunit GatC [Candidatus Peregrinibacteria bacterium]|nr:Asp-tRNA(Asn)/Glu-tRNA(Gln) amidotransferase subunit GatC [Candidatus Peregrinibacteria bacterium]
MIEKKDIEKLAHLSRIEVSEEEKDVLRKDMESILDYVSQIKEAVSQVLPKEAGELRNVMREDNNPHEKGLYTKEIMDEVPDTENGYVKVKQIL